MQVNQDHLDAEVVAAWLDGSLDRAARAEAEAHAADCDRCQAVLATMVRIEPEPAHRKAWFTVPLRWALPLATAAAALSIWVAVNRNARVPEAPQVTTATPASPKAPEPADRALDSVAPVQPAPATPQGLRQDQQAANTRGAPRAARTRGDQTRKEAAKATVPLPAVAETVSVDQLARERATVQSELPKVAAAAPASAPPPPPPSQAQTQAQTQTRIAPASPPVETQAVRRELGQARAGSIAFGVREFASPDLAARWRLGANGTIHRSIDAGKTWVAQTSGVTTELLSASAPAANICWIVGRSGVVLLTTDGATWRRVAFPELVDLRSVTATDARTASVTTADGRVFRTTDGGITWVN
jgi:hypothetical protein